MRKITPGELADELESGRWRKARGQLAKAGNRRCCLGVACELIGVPWFERWIPNTVGIYPTAGFIPGDLVREFAPFLKRMSSNLADPGIQGTLSQMNDKTAGWGAVIAWLRAQESQA